MTLVEVASCAVFSVTYFCVGKKMTLKAAFWARIARFHLPLSAFKPKLRVCSAVMFPHVHMNFIIKENPSHLRKKQRSPDGGQR